MTLEFKSDTTNAEMKVVKL